MRFLFGGGWPSSRVGGASLGSYRDSYLVEIQKDESSLRFNAPKMHRQVQLLKELSDGVWVDIRGLKFKMQLIWLLLNLYARKQIFTSLNEEGIADEQMKWYIEKQASSENQITLSAC